MTKYSEHGLEELMRQSCAGNSKAYTELLSAITPVIRGIVRAKAVSSTSEGQEDLVQDILLTIHTKKSSWRHDAPFRPWLYAIVRHKVIDNFRARGRRIFMDIADFENILTCEAIDPSNAIDRDKLLRKLTGKTADVMNAIIQDGDTVEDTAKRFKMKPNAVRVAFHRGLKKLATLSRE